jgi:hypothetical protein
MTEQVKELFSTLICNYDFPEEFAKDLAEFLSEEGYTRTGQGKWVRYPYNSGIYCSLCRHKRRYKDIQDKFCPNCGARMTEET